MKISEKKTLVLTLMAIIFTTAFGARTKELYLHGRVKESFAKTDLPGAHVYMLDSLGNVTDSVRANMGLRYVNGDYDTLSYFSMRVPRVDSVYTIRVSCDGYQTETFDYPVQNIGKREEYREMGNIYLQRAPQMLKEVTVTSSKIKFYNKGDTVVFNAEAFQLAEGSMLDALVAQLPGVELSNNGQIKVNGEFVESLLLNGKEFLDGNNNLMLENIAAYTVKNIEVYEAQSRDAQFRNDVSAPKQLTMDVKLKKEYNIGWLVNAQGGYGTDNRYLAKLFASWFNPTTRVTVLGNANNLNDNRQPGRNDSWTPDMMPDGKKEYQMAGADYNYEDNEGTRRARGQLTFARSNNRNTRTTSRINFLPGGDTYENSFSRSTFTETAVRTSHYYAARSDSKLFNYGMYLNGGYSRTKNVLSDLSGAFNEEQPDMTMEILESIYTDAKPGALEQVINRSRTRTDGWNKTYSLGIDPNFGFNIPKTQDYLTLNLDFHYSSSKDYQWKDYDINYGADPKPAVQRRQYTDNTPNHTLQMASELSYQSSVGDVYWRISYAYRFEDKVKDSYMYALERLNDMGQYGVLPTDYVEAFDPANSYRSRLITNKHSLEPYFNYFKMFDNNTSLNISLSPQLDLTHRHLNYWRNDRDYRLSDTKATVTINSIWTGRVEYAFGYKGEGRQRRAQNHIRYSYRIEPTLPDMVDMLDIVDDSNPLNIYLGNPDLKTQVRHNHLVRWQFSPAAHTFTNILYLGAIHTSNELTRGYTYETATGVRYNRMYNLNGNKRLAMTDELSWQFGSIKQFTLSSETDVARSWQTDMIGVNKETPELTKVNYRSISEKLNLSWQIGRQVLRLRCDWSNRHTTSTQEGFNTLNANHVNYGLSGTFTLPAGFGINTDFTCYTRRGYGSEALDTTDPVWNMRLSYCPVRHSRWVFMVDGFDMLHKLSNVTYAVTASGRTVAYTNALPRYILATVQYRLNIQPKKR